MARVRCNACGGDYDPVGRDGVRYFHVCPPLEIVTVADGLGVVSEIALGTDHGKIIVRTDEERREAEKDPRVVGNVVVERARRLELREGHRDENPQPGDLPRGAKVRPIVAEGAGVTPVR